MATFTGDTTNGSPVITAVADTSFLSVHQHLTGAGLPDPARIISIVANTSVTLADDATATASGVTIDSHPFALVNFSPTTSLSASVTLSVAVATAFAFAPASSLAAAVDLEVAQAHAFGIAPNTSLDTAITLKVSQARAFAFAPASALAASVALTQSRGTAFAFAPASSLQASVQLSGTSSTLTTCGVVDGILSLWGIFQRCQAPTFAINEALNILNKSLQLVWNNAEGRDYWTRAPLTITLADGDSSQDLPNNIQNVVGPCRVAATKRPLVPLGTLAELESFAALYLNGETETEPLAFHIDRLAQSGDDPAKCVFHVTPAATTETLSFLLEVVTEAPRYDIADLSTCPVVPIPHSYVESLLLPVARYHASSYYLFRQPNLKESIDREWQEAREALGLADPLPGKSGDNINKREGGKPA